MQPILAYILRLRLNAFARSLRSLAGRDPFGLALALGAIAAGTVFFARNIHRVEMLIMIPMLHLALVNFIHGMRKDAQFLASLGVSRRVLFMWEYSILALPAVLLLAFSAYPQAMLLPIALSALIAPTPPFAWSHRQLMPSRQHTFFFSQKAIRRGFRKFFTWLVPPLAFEWWGGLRQRRLALIILWTGAFLLAWQPFLLSVVLFFLVITPIEFYGRGEHRSMVQSLYRSPSQFLRLKIKQGFRGYAMLLTPPVMLGMAYYLLHNPSSVGANMLIAQVPLFLAALAASLAVSFILTSLCVVAKYAFYVEGMPFMFAVSSMVTLTLATLWHPYISIIGLSVSFSILIPKATKRLRILFS